MDDIQLQRYERVREELVQHQQEAAGQQIAAHAAAQQQQQQQQAAVQQQIRRPATYDQFYQSLIPLPAVPIAPAPAPQAPVSKTKEQKRAEKREAKQIVQDSDEEYARVNKQLQRNPRLVSEEELRGMNVFQQRSTRDRWSKKKMPHYKLTREETLQRIFNEGDYSNFENLDLLMRNFVANHELEKFKQMYQIDEHSDPQAICEQIKESGEGVSALMNPALRLALSLAQKTEGITDEMKQFYLELDEAMTTAVMEETLLHQPHRGRLRRYFEDRGAENPDEEVEHAVEANEAQQIQIAKRLLLMQLSDFQKVTNMADGGVDSTPWDSSMAVALSHCSRVVLTLPRTDEGASDKQQQQAMWRSILTIDGENTAQDNRRGSSTHSVRRRSVKENGDVRSKEKKKWFNPIGQRGMNCAIGGLANAGVSGKTICNDGTCGHFYSMHKEANASNYGAMLMGIESDAYGVMNQMGHTHDLRATAEKASSLGGQRTDEIGNKYGGRQCNLTGMSAHDIGEWMQALERKMLRWQQQPGGMASDDAIRTMKQLAGHKLDAAGWASLRDTLGVSENVADGFHA